jgi:hypothetical protein
VEVDTLYFGGLQRDFKQKLTLAEIKERNAGCKMFIDNGVCKKVFNDILKEYSEALFSYGETAETRDIMFNNLNVVLKVEQKIKMYADSVEKKVEFDKNEPL